MLALFVQWRHIRDTSSDEWPDVVAFDAAIRQGNARANAPATARSGRRSCNVPGVPLDQAPIDHFTAAEWAARGQQLQEHQPDGLDLAEGVIDGCSPWACHGETEPAQSDFRLTS